MARYSTISLPTNLYEKIQKMIEEKPDTGYNSVADFSKEAIRLHVAELKKELQQDFLRRLDVPLILKQVERLSAIDSGTYGEIFDKGNCMICVFSQEFKIVECNYWFFSNLGYGAKGELIGKDIGVVFDDEKLKSRIKKETLTNYDVKAVRKDGKSLDITLSVTYLTGRALYIGVLQDVTLLKYLLDKEKKTRAIYEHLIDEIGDLVAVIQDGKVKYVNKEVGKGGFTQEELIGVRVDAADMLIPEEERERIVNLLKEVQEGKGDVKSVKFKGLTKKGEIFTFEASFKRIDFEGRPAVLVTRKMLS